MEKRLSKIISDIFDIKQHEITNESSMENIEKWDSLGHLKLIIAIEKEFGVSLGTVEMIELTSFTKIILYLKDSINPGSD